jgi:hypothetical protein
MTKVKVLRDDEAWALAQLCKCLRWDHFKDLSANQTELNPMDGATIKLRCALAEAGLIRVRRGAS